MRKSPKNWGQDEYNRIEDKKIGTHCADHQQLKLSLDLSVVFAFNYTCLTLQEISVVVVVVVVVVVQRKCLRCHAFTLSSHN